MQLLYDTLLIKNERFDFVPSLADRFSETDDSRTFTFHIRPGVKFHNGKALTSADVKYTFDSIASPALKSPMRGVFDKFASIETPDQETVIFHAREPFYSFIGNLPAIGIVPEGAGVENIDSPIGSGPYRFVSYREGEAVKLQANPDYWAGAPIIRFVDVRVISDNGTRQAAIMSGEVDLAYNAEFDPETTRALAGRPGLQVIEGNGTNIAHLGVNLTTPLLASREVRQAIACAIDRQAIIHSLLRDQAREADSILPPEQWAFESDITVYNYNPDWAKTLLDRAGLIDPDGEGPQSRFELTLMTSTNQLSRNIGAIIQDQLRRVGIQLNLSSLETATLLDKISKAQFDLYYLISVGGNQSPDIFQFVYHSRYQDAGFNEAISKLRAEADPLKMRSIFEELDRILARREYCRDSEVYRLAARAAALAEPNEGAARKQLYLRINSILTDRGGANRSRYCNPQMNAWIVEAERITDRSGKKSLYSLVQKTASDDLPQIYLWYPANVLIASKRVGNIQIEPSGAWFFVSTLTLS